MLRPGFDLLQITTSTLARGALRWAGILTLALLTHNAWAQNVNLALHRPVAASSTYKGAVPERAVDGVKTDLSMEKDRAVITAFGIGFQWWQVDLGAEYVISQVNIFKCSDCTVRAIDRSMLAVGNDPNFGGHIEPDPWRAAGGQGVNILDQGDPVYVRSNGLRGRYVRIWRAVYGAQLTLGEVEVFGTLSGNAISNAAAVGNEAAVLELLETDPSTQNADAALATAIERGDEAMVSTILSRQSRVSPSNMEMAFDSTRYTRSVALLVVEKGKGEPTRQHLDLALAKNDEATAKAIIKRKKDLVTSAHVERSIASQNTQLLELMLATGVRVEPKVVTMAVEQRNVDLVRRLLDDNGGAASPVMLSTALRNNDQPMVQLLRKRTKPDSEAFVLVARQNNLDMYMDMAIENGVPDNRSLEVAMDSNNKQILMEGLRNGGNANEALTYAVSKNNRMGIDAALGRNGVDGTKVVPYAVTNGDVELATLLIETKSVPADLVLEEAVKQDKVAMIRYALGTGATHPDKYLITMVEKGHDDLSRMMVDHGADANKGMQAAIDRNKVDLAEYFITKGGATVNAPAYMTKAAATDQAMTALLLEHGADANSGLLTAVKANKGDIVQLLVDKGARPEPGLPLASGIGSLQLVAILVQGGAPPQPGMLPACQKGHVDVVRYLAAAGADARSSELIQAAVAGLHVPVASLLFELGADKDMKITEGGNLIHLACAQEDCLNMLSDLLRRGVDPLLKDNKGNTALHVAVMQGKENSPAIAALVNAGIDIDALNNAGDTPFKVAKGPRNRKTLKELGADKKK